MLRNTLLVLGVLALAAPAFATITWDQNVTSCDFTVSITISGWAQVICQDNDIVFSGETCQQAPGDWHQTVLCGEAYLWDYDKSSQDAWAEGYFESYDKAYLWWRSNADIYAKIDPGDNLKNTDADEIATWFTVAATGETGQGPLLNGHYVSDGMIPLDQLGCYASDNARTGVPHGLECCQNNLEDGIMELCGTCFYDDQYCFAMSDGHAFSYWYLNLPAPSAGTLLWHARIHRQGLADAAGAYTAPIDVDFFEGSHVSYP